MENNRTMEITKVLYRELWNFDLRKKKKWQITKNKKV